MAVQARLIGRLGGGIEWGDCPAFDPTDPLRDAIHVYEPCVILVDAGDGATAAVGSASGTSAWQTLDALGAGAGERTVAVPVPAGTYIIQAIRAFGAGADKFKPARYAILDI